MRPSSSNPPPSSLSPPPFWHRNSPLPYLFFGFGFMLVLIAAALVMLACSFRNRHSRRTAAALEPEKPVWFMESPTVADSSPKIVVIMAGEENPSHLAIPVSSSSDCVCKV
ncbi:protein GLUTAMINE DUMPER 2-like [Andrographis paniculata]|uniref:protein GLUTAMINE DUMPER 2-like n=1 Tax=Andrographis paniculata TaxID=175694 RepID=UPI0021E830C9|nr:protein GLUTAMINE DUMPER 2-like [Andrographis paniculata]